MATSTPPHPTPTPPTGSSQPAPATVDAPTPATRRVRIPQLAVGIVLTAGAALAFLLWNASTVQRTAVLALSDDIERGEVVTREDLQVVHIGTDDPLATTPVEDLDLVVGRVAVTAMEAGTLVTDGQFIEGAALVPGSGVVGLALAPGQYPTPHLRVGDLVNVLEVSAGQSVLVEAAEVVSLEVVGTQGQRFVSVQTGEAVAGEVAAAAASGEVRLVLVARDGEGASS